MSYDWVKGFVEANDESPVVEGATLYKKGGKPESGNVWGGRYTLEDGRVFRMKSEELAQLPEGYPKWKLS